MLQHFVRDYISRVLLLLKNRPQESLAEYETVLKVAPNRFNALYGAACAAEASGNAGAAHRYFQKLTEIAVGNERRELVTARNKMAAARKRKVTSVAHRFVP